MTLTGKPDRVVLFVGDIFLFYLALWITLLLRYFEVPDREVIIEHFIPFTLLFFIWTLVFYIAGLYDRQSEFLESRLPSIILNAQIVNIIIAALFFFLVPFFSIAPKTNLLIYLIISFGLIVGWRLYLVPLTGTRRRQEALLVAGGEDMHTLYKEVNRNNRFRFIFKDIVSLDEVQESKIEKVLKSYIEENDISVIALDMQHTAVKPLLTPMYQLMFKGVRFIDANHLYEEIYYKIPLSLLSRGSFIEYLSPHGGLLYDTVKRLIDIIASIILGSIALVLLPLVSLAVVLESGRPIFITQKRIGQYGRPIIIYKYRTMQRSEEGVWVGETDNVVTRVGVFLRKTRIDELPQLWNILRGDLSLIGPRTDIAGLAKRLVEKIPYYGVRYLVKPGLTGWAQTNQEVKPQSVEETKERLAYDLYYIKNRSLFLDITIALRTIKTVLSRSGS